MGSTSYCLSKREARFTYKQVESYLDHGIKLKEGDIVFDVGANTGLFTVWISRLFKHNLRIFSFEPVPAIYKALDLNVKEHCQDNVKPYNLALGDKEGTVDIRFFPHASVMSGIEPSESFDGRPGFKKMLLALSKDRLPDFASWLKWFPKFLWPFVIDRVTSIAFQSIKTTCELSTLSKVARDNNLHRIDLLKIDAERSELQVLRGIDADTYKIIRQIFIEADSWESEGQLILDLLRTHGFSQIYVEQEKWAVGTTEMANVYATRDLAES